MDYPIRNTNAPQPVLAIVPALPDILQGTTDPFHVPPGLEQDLPCVLHCTSNKNHIAYAIMSNHISERHYNKFNNEIQLPD